MTSGPLTPEWIAHLKHFNRLFVGFSGGLDSTVLTICPCWRIQLREKLTAVHIHHGISINASYWQKHCQEFCAALAIPCITQAVDFNRLANIEEGARRARYAAFATLLKERDGLLLGHHLDDQAETLLLQLFRGAGVDGLASMADFGSLGLGTVVRPLLAVNRASLHAYALHHGLTWIEDESNQDVHYSRNYLRQNIIPLLAEKWPGVLGI